jgi:hypothetical protein
MTGKSYFLARIATSLVGMIALTAVAALWLGGAHSAYFGLLTTWGIMPFRFPFLDVDGSLAAWDCSRLGVDVILADPCDVLQRGYNYSPFWMTIDWVPLGRIDRPAVGLALGIGFLVSLSALPPPLSTTEMMARIAAVLSTMVVFAIERANPDILIFLLVLVMLALMRRSLIARVLGYCIVFLAGAIKYYPFVLFGFVLRERPRFLVLITLAALAGLTLFGLAYDAQIREGFPHIAGGSPFGDMFGVKNFPLGVAVAVWAKTGSSGAAAAAAALMALLVLGPVLWIVSRYWTVSDISGALQRLDEPRRLALLAGSLLLAGCFFAGQSIGYRGIFLLLVLPGFFAIGRDEVCGSAAVTARLAAISIPPLMWAEAIRLWVHSAVSDYLDPVDGWSIPGQPIDFLAWCVREVSWWVFIAILLSILLGFIANSPAIQMARHFAWLKEKA